MGVPHQPTDFPKNTFYQLFCLLGGRGGWTNSAWFPSGGNNLGEMTHALHRGGLFLYSSHLCFSKHIFLTLLDYLHQIGFTLSTIMKPSFFSLLFRALFDGVKRLHLSWILPHAELTTTYQPPPPAVWLLPLLQAGLLENLFTLYLWKLYVVTLIYVVTNLIYAPLVCCSQTRCSLTFAKRINRKKTAKIVSTQTHISDN